MGFQVIYFQRMWRWVFSWATVADSLPVSSSLIILHLCGKWEQTKWHKPFTETNRVPLARHGKLLASALIYKGIARPLLHCGVTRCIKNLFSRKTSGWIGQIKRYLYLEFYNFCFFFEFSIFCFLFMFSAK